VRAEDYKKITLDYLLQNCSFGDLSHMDADVLLMGDSHAHHFKPFVEQLARDAGLRAIYHVQGGCFPTVPDEGRHDMSKVEQTCRERNANLLALASRVKYVVLAGYWSSLPDRNMEKELRTAVDRIIKAGAVPVIFKDNPSYEPDLSRCILYKRRGWLEPEQNCNIPSDAAIGRQAKYDSAIDKVRRDYPQSLAIDPKPVMCDDRECATYVSNIAFYKDSNHLNTRAAQLLGERYITAFGNPLRKSAMNVGANANVK